MSPASSSAAAGEKLVLLGGAARRARAAASSSGVIHGLKTGDAPAVDLAAEKRLQDLILGADPRGPRARPRTT